MSATNGFCHWWYKERVYLARFMEPHGSHIRKLAFNTLRPRQNGRHFPDDIFKWIFLNENVWISIKISLKFVPRGPVCNIPASVQMMAWRRPGDKPLSEPMTVSLLTHICVTWPQWVNSSIRLGTMELPTVFFNPSYKYIVVFEMI